MIDDCTAIVMAGGKSLRMGGDKAMLMLGEQTLLARVVGIVAPIFAQVLVSVRENRPDIGLRQILDSHANAGPLAGLCAALEQAGSPWVFAVATDMPFVKPALIELLAARRAGFDAVVPVVHGHPQPLAAFYSVTALATIRALLDETGVKNALINSSPRRRPGSSSLFFLDSGPGLKHSGVTFFRRNDDSRINQRFPNGKGGKRSLRAALLCLNVCYVDESELIAADPGLRSFFDLDTPQDLAAARGEQS
jgi:molybdopterin-guanine dinucleotide biosynthesis protein A